MCRAVGVQWDFSAGQLKTTACCCKIVITAALTTVSEMVAVASSMASLHAINSVLGLAVSWSYTITSTCLPGSAPPTCFPPGWTVAVLHFRMSSGASTSIRGSCSLGGCVSTWTCKVPSKLDPCLQISALHPSHLQTASQCMIVLKLHLPPTLETLSLASKSFWQVSSASAAALRFILDQKHLKQF